MRVLGATAALCLATACANSGSAIAGAVVNTAIATGVAAARRADGQCYTPCNPGTKCNEKTGTCDPLPCGGKCRPDEHCEGHYLGERCMPNVALEILGTSSTGTDPAPAGPADAGTRLPPRSDDVPRAPVQGPGLEAPR
ncbi:MAG: hypothetical protein IT380_10770 [Myxococcales bacterium]|nr:hypothetical protein [Myxococcales bacterium]